MLMQNAIAKMIQKPCEANAGREICISVFEPRSLPALAHYHPRSDSLARLGRLPSFGPLISGDSQVSNQISNAVLANAFGIKTRPRLLLLMRS